MAEAIVTTGNTGTVKAFNSVMYQGITQNNVTITPDDGSDEIRVNAGPMATFSAGDKVSFTLTTGPKGRLASEVKKG